MKMGEMPSVHCEIAKMESRLDKLLRGEHRRNIFMNVLMCGT